MDIKLNEKDLTDLLNFIGVKIADSKDPEFGKSICCVASFATRLVAAVVLGVADSREEAINGVNSAFEDSRNLVNSVYDTVEMIENLHQGKVH